MKTIGFIGGGRITRIILEALTNARIRFRKTYVYDSNPQALENLSSLYEEVEVSDFDASKAVSADLVFIALHPPVLIDTITSLRELFNKNALIVSLAPKITLNKLSSVLPDCGNLARMNPNAGTFINDGFNPVCFLPSTDKSLKKDFMLLFEEFGQIPETEESKIEAYAVICAMGHTYFWFQLQHLKELAVSFGLSEEEAREAITTMMHGTTSTLFDSGLPYNEVIDLVPVKPISEAEATIKNIYDQYLPAIFNKIKP